MTTSACPECGFFITPARERHGGAVRYWRLLRLHRWLDILVVSLWLIALVLSYRVISLSPRHGVVILTIVAGVGVVGMGYCLRHRRKRKE